MKIFLGGLFIGLFLGGGFVGWFAPSKVVLKETQEKIQQLGEEDLRRYAEARTADEKLKAADALYEKAMLLFLANLGTHVKGLPLKAPVARIATDEMSAGTEQTAVDKAAPVFVEPTKPGNAKEETLVIPGPQGDRLKNLTAFHGASVVDKMTPAIRRLNGNYEGVLNYLAGPKKGTQDSVVLEVELQWADEKLTGGIEVKMTNQEGFQHSHQRGGQGSILRTVPSNKNLMYLESAPGRFILLDISRTDLLRGDYYQTDGSWQGKVLLNRR